MEIKLIDLITFLRLFFIEPSFVPDCFNIINNANSINNGNIYSVNDIRRYFELFWDSSITKMHLAHLFCTNFWYFLHKDDLCYARQDKL